MINKEEDLQRPCDCCDFELEWANVNLKELELERKCRNALMRKMKFKARICQKEVDQYEEAIECCRTQISNITDNLNKDKIARKKAKNEDRMEDEENFWYKTFVARVMLKNLRKEIKMEQHQKKDHVKQRDNFLFLYDLMNTVVHRVWPMGSSGYSIVYYGDGHHEYQAPEEECTC